MAEGVHGRGTCVAGGYVWQGACVAGRYVQQGACMVGGMCSRRDDHCSGRYASIVMHSCFVKCFHDICDICQKSVQFYHV